MGSVCTSMNTLLSVSFLVGLLGQLTETWAIAGFNEIGYGSCRSADVSRYPNHYLKTGAINMLECVAQCNAEQGCTHMEWGLNGYGQNQCVIFAPQQQQALVGWTFVHGNGGQSITQANGWSQVSTCFAVATTEVTASYNFLGFGSCRSADVSRYPNHYLKIGAVNSEECVAQCNADQGCTHMEWGLNGLGQSQCVIFSPQQQQGITPPGWTFVLGNGGQSITQANGWSHRLVPQRQPVDIPEPLSQDGSHQCLDSLRMRKAMQFRRGVHPYGMGPQWQWREAMCYLLPDV